MLAILYALSEFFKVLKFFDQEASAFSSMLKFRLRLPAPPPQRIVIS